MLHVMLIGEVVPTWDSTREEERFTFWTKDLTIVTDVRCRLVVTAIEKYSMSSVVARSRSTGQLHWCRPPLTACFRPL